MNKQELIKKWEKEIEDDKEHLDNKNLDYASRCQVLGRINAISSILEDIKNLNGETVKRQELIDFLKWKEGSYCGSSLNQEAEVNRYLKSINE